MTMAAIGGNVDAVRFLLDRGVDPDQRDSDGGTPLMAAAFQGRAQVVTVLLDTGADINAVDKRGRTAVYRARERGFTAIIKQIEDAAADPRRAARVAMIKKRKANLALLGSRLPAIEEAEKYADYLARDGRYTQAMERYIIALKQTPGGTEPQYRICEKAIRLAHSMKPQPLVPEEAKEYVQRAMAFIRRGEDVHILTMAVEEMEKALAIAPWWPDAHFNLGILKGKTQDPAGGIRSLKLYLLAAPQAPDTEAVRKKIVDLEVDQELQKRR